MPEWKENKHGSGQNDLHCFNCTWFQPWDFSIEPRRPTEPNGGSVEEERERAAAIDPVEPTEEATQLGFCRAKSVPITNLNMDVLYDNKAGFFKSSYQGSENELLNEVAAYNATEFWCRKWTRALHPFAWPPIPAN